MALEDDKSGHRMRLWQRFENGGISALAEYEIVELLLTYAIARKDVKPIAKALLKKFGNLKNILRADKAELTSVEGMGDASATMIRFVSSIIPLYHLQVLEESPLELDSVDKLVEFFRARIGAERIEVLEMACFDSQLRLLPKGAIRLFEGSANTANVDIRRIVECAIKLGASSIVLSHNHPNGDAKPSLADIEFTRNLSNACRPIKLDFIEHIIIAKNSFFSFRRDGRFDVLYDSTSQEEYYESSVASRKKRLKIQ